MILTEIFSKYENAYDDPADDQSIPKLSDLRKTKLTLGQINRLRLMSDVRKYELQQSLEDIQKQYGKPADTGSGGF
jgi:hypothetical protein